MPGPDIFFAMAVLRLGVRPSLRIMKSITMSVAVRKPLIKHAQRLTKEAPIGARIEAYTA